MKVRFSVARNGDLEQEFDVEFVDFHEVAIKKSEK